MPEVWGLLSKAQDDAQTIGEAIVEAVDAHEADASAHLGATESLQSHKAAEIIDHIAGSVVADKLSMTEYQARTIFEALDKWAVTGSVDNVVWPGVSLWSDYSPSNPAELLSVDSAIPDYITWTKDILIHFVAKVAETTNKKVFFGYGVRSGDDVHDGFGFKIVNGTLYGYLDADGTIDTVALTVDSLYTAHCYRAQWVASEKTCYFFIDGVEVGSLAVASTTGTGDGDILIRLETTASGESYFFVYDLFTAREI